MRMLIHLWIGLTLVLAIYGDDMTKRAAEGSGSGDGPPLNQGTGASDDEDYGDSYGSESSISASFDSASDYESSGGSEYSDSASESTDFTPSEDYPVAETTDQDNSIKFRGEFTIHGISGGTLDWMDAFSNPQSKTFKQMSNLISPMIQTALESKKNTRNGLRKVRILSFRQGSVIVEYEASYTPESSVSEDQVRKSLKEAITTSNFGKLQVDPKSISSVSAIRPQSVIVTTQPPRPEKTTSILTTSSITTTVSSREQTGRRHKTDPPAVPTTQNNAINDRTEPNKNTGGSGNEVDPITIDDTPDNGIPVDGGNDLDNEIEDMDKNKVEENPETETQNFWDKNKVEENPETETQNFWDKLFSHPLILAGLVGAVVIALLTVVLLLMFIVYRIKKKDEGSYSLDEPHKVKDPMAYWKDTKEFYA